MDPRRKRLYIIIIIVCIVASIGVFLWSRNSSPKAELPTDNIPQQADTTPASQVPVMNADGSYTPPAVFPANDKLDTVLLDSSAYKVLEAYQPAQVGPAELGREDPFKNY